ncbi:DUF2726 domain-containing protein [Deinococcus gobiensis]|uniref:DUF2726 domain-containing protein n=1 Tax=Deinococcus gobiensis (strain DSM 21396 / JCM 16679 / CGMCC 1.7299 / I-0) TaxID=745776 RepID=H8H2P7_DEIGI|nr:DUF2726 domain-containing protein [Deinococcus gobiensis]AFD27794.1 hypothetical protein DGo_PC0002 [Deinococcus gobiensis I-0]
MALELRQRRLLAALAAHDGEVPNDVLASAVQSPPGVAFGLMVRLCEIGMAVQTPAGWKLEDWALPLAREDLARSVHLALVIPQDDLLRPPCDSRTERRVFEVCTRLFEGSVVLPNVPLARVVDADAAQHYLDREDQRFLANPSTQVDIVVLGRRLLPVLAIEADGPQHDADPQHSRDARKNRILRVAGLPVARLRVREQMSDDVLAHHIGRALWDAARIARPSQRGHVELARALSRLA